MDRLDRFCHFKRMKMHQDEDWVSIYDGREGSGKSTAAIWDAIATSGDLFDIHKHICYDPEEFMRLVDDAPRYGSLILDEAGEAFFSRSFRDNINVSIAKTLQQMRYRNLNVILCVPHKDYIDLIGRVRARSWTHLEPNKKGCGEFMMPFRNKYHSRDEPYWKKQFHYDFQRLPTYIYDEYRLLKESKSRERMGRYIDEVEKKADRQKDITLDDVIDKINGMDDNKCLLNRNGHYDSDLIRHKLGISASLSRVVVKTLKSASLN